VGKFKKR